MLTKQEHIEHWLKTAEKERDMMQYLLEGKKYVYALFFGHLLLEKFVKALWIKTHEENTPPKAHNLLKLIDECNLQLDAEQRKFLLKLNQYQVESRYADDIERLYKVTDYKLVIEYFAKIEEIEQCLRKNLP